MNLPFGKYRGTSVYDVPKSYLRWILHNCDLDYGLKTAAHRALGVKPHTLPSQIDEKETRDPSRLWSTEWICKTLGIAEEDILAAIVRGDIPRVQISADNGKQYYRSDTIDDVLDTLRR